MAFKVRNKRNDNGTYTVSYGKGGNKLTGRMAKEDGKWQHNAGSARFVTMKECKEDWGAWAEANYGGKGGTKPAEPTTPPASGPPPIRRSSGPPSLPPKKKAAVDLTKPEASDPFDPRFTYPADHPRQGLRRQLTPLGQLKEIREWHRKHTERLGNLAYGAYKPIIEAVEKCIARECPDLIAKEQGNEADRTSKE